MSLFGDSAKEDEDEGVGKQLGAITSKNKLPKTPDFTEWGAKARKGSPFLLDDFSSGAPANTTKP